MTSSEGKRWAWKHIYVSDKTQKERPGYYSRFAVCTWTTNLATTNRRNSVSSAEQKLLERRTVRKRLSAFSIFALRCYERESESAKCHRPLRIIEYRCQKRMPGQRRTSRGETICLPLSAPIFAKRTLPLSKNHRPLKRQKCSFGVTVEGRERELLVAERMLQRNKILVIYVSILTFRGLNSFPAGTAFSRSILPANKTRNGESCRGLRKPERPLRSGHLCGVPGRTLRRTFVFSFGDVVFVLL